MIIVPLMINQTEICYRKISLNVSGSYPLGQKFDFKEWIIRI